MTYYTRITEDSFLKRRVIKRDLINILKKHGFKRSFWKHPFSEVYVKGDFKAEVYNREEIDSGSKEHGIPPYSYGVAGVEIEGPPDFMNQAFKKELHSYYDKKMGKKPTKKRTREKEESSGLEGRVGVFILFLLGGLALSIYSLTATGSAISNLAGTTKGLFGVLLFIAGLAGLVFSRKR